METIGVPLVEKLYLRHDLVLFKVSSLLDLYAHILERTPRSSSSALRQPSHLFWSSSHSTHSGSLGPYNEGAAREQHTKLIDQLSEPSSQLIHWVSHPSEEETSAEPNTCI